MLFPRFQPQAALMFLVATGFLSTSCFHKKYETPITKNTQQPDKVLFDQAVKDIEHGRYETARISLQTLMNTYESSEYMAKAKLAVADSWYREGGANGMAQAEAEYKDFQLFYPNMEEAAEAQNRICDIHFHEMNKSDRDYTQTVQAESECRTLITQYPNSKFVPQATQRLREIQESLAEHEFVVGHFYWNHEMNPAAANRLNAAIDQYPLYSKGGEALYEAGDSYSKMGPRFRNTAADMFSRVVREYPLSERAEDAKKRLEDMEKPVPQADQAALDREKYDQANYHKPGMMGRTFGLLKSGPDVSHAAKSGAPTMTDPKRTIPKSVPIPTNTDQNGSTGGTGSGTTDVTASTAPANSALDTKPDARDPNAAPANGASANGSTPSTAPANGTAAPAAAAAGTEAAAANAPLPTNRDAELKKFREKQAKKQAKLDKKKKKDQSQGQEQLNQSNGSQNANTSPGVPNATAPPATANPTNPPQTSPQQ
jgi:outer membrane protein assembly factor BamD